MNNQAETFCRDAQKHFSDNDIQDREVPDGPGVFPTVPLEEKSADSSTDEDYDEEFVEGNPFAPINGTANAPSISIFENNSENLIDISDVDDLGTLLADIESKMPLAEGDRRSLARAVERVGFDVLAFYKSVRHQHRPPFYGKWGIFYVDKGLVLVSELLKLWDPSFTPGTVPGFGSTIQWAYDFLQAHERYHYKFDMYALSAESVARQSLYRPLKNAYRSCKHRQVEEALANRDTWMRAKRKVTQCRKKGHAVAGIASRDFAHEFMKIQPGAYAQFERPEFELKGILASNLLDQDFSCTRARRDQVPWVGVVPGTLNPKTNCPEHVLKTAGAGVAVGTAFRLPKVTTVIESQDFSDLLETRYPTIKQQWFATKAKLEREPCLPGLDFKKWGAIERQWSVRITIKFRAHLRQIDAENGVWEAEEIGPHKAMGHG